jgi:hypothetical protein
MLQRFAQKKVRVVGNTTGAILFIVGGIVLGYLVFTKRIFQSSGTNAATTPPATPGGNPLDPNSQYSPGQLPNYTIPTQPTPNPLGIPSQLLYPR